MLEKYLKKLAELKREGDREKGEIVDKMEMLKKLIATFSLC
jgi:hypothetical protein